MALPRSRRVAAMAATTACLLVLTACGSKGTPSANGTDQPTGQGQIGDVGNSATTTPATATTTSSSGGTQTPAYPSDAKSYGLEILKAIAANDDGRIVDLSSLNTAQYIQQQNYKSKNGQWTYTGCQSGSTQSCHYYNQTGDIASVGVETAKLGKPGAVNSVYIEGGSFPTDPGSYVSSFGSAWESGSYAKMVALSATSIANHFLNVPKFSSVNAGFTYSAPHPCATNSGKTCVDLAQVGGTATLSVQHLIVDTTKISAGKPNGIIGYE